METLAEHPDEWKSYQGIGWCDTAVNNLRFAKAMGFKYVYHGRLNNPIYGEDYEMDYAYKEGLRFYFHEPHFLIQPLVNIKLSSEEVAKLKSRWPWEFRYFPELPRTYHPEHWKAIKQYQPDIYEKYKQTFEKYKAWGDPTKPFPANLLVYNFWPDGSFEPLPDFQQQAVIKSTVRRIVDHIKHKAEIRKLDYRCAGLIFDTPNIWDTYMTKGGDRDYASVHPGITHQYATFKEGTLAYFKALRGAMKAAFRGRPIRFIYEPNGRFWDVWVKPVKESAYPETVKQGIVGDMLMEEGADLGWLNETDTYQTGWFTKGLHCNVGSSTPGLEKDYSKYRQVLGGCAINGAWFNWFGRHGATEWFSYWRDIDEALKISRMIPNWDNLNDVPLSERSYDPVANIYHSTKSYADENIVYTRQPNTGILFVKFLTAAGKVVLHSDEIVTKVQKVNEFMEPGDDGQTDLMINGAEISIKWDEAYRRKAYLIHLVSNRKSV